jgi:creatinine amidohydrolase
VKPPASPSILQDTIAEMTYPEVAAAIHRGAIGLWATGVIEQHGPHLPVGTDIYIPSVRLRAVRTALARQGVEALIIPPFYWGVNVVSASFPATIKVRAELVTELLTDVMKSLAGDGLRHLFLVSGHNDRAHNEAVIEATRRGWHSAGLLPRFVCEASLLTRLGADPASPHLLPFDLARDDPPAPFLDIHAGEWETSIMLGHHGELVKRELLPSLEPTNLGREQLMAWRQGHEVARRITPQGYFGAPADATAERGLHVIETEARAIARAVQRCLENDQRT